MQSQVASPEELKTEFYASINLEYLYTPPKEEFKNNCIENSGAHFGPSKQEIDYWTKHCKYTKMDDT